MVRISFLFPMVPWASHHFTYDKAELQCRSRAQEELLGRAELSVSAENDACRPSRGDAALENKSNTYS